MSDHVKQRLYERYDIIATNDFIADLSFRCAARDGRLLVKRDAVEVWDINVPPTIRCVFDRYNLILKTVLKP